MKNSLLIVVILVLAVGVMFYIYNSNKYSELSPSSFNSDSSGLSSVIDACACELKSSYTWGDKKVNGEWPIPCEEGKHTVESWTCVEDKSDPKCTSIDVKRPGIPTVLKYSGVWSLATKCVPN